MPQQPSAPPAVTTKTRAATRVAVAVAGLSLLAIATYGFGYFFGLEARPPGEQQPKISSLAITEPEKSPCNAEPVPIGGGRCYPGCESDKDCSEGVSVSSWEECRARAITLCGYTETCLNNICGPKEPLCVSGVCSRPNFAPSEEQCKSTVPGAPVGVGAGTPTNTCKEGNGRCYRSCQSDDDCSEDSKKYQECVASAAVQRACAGEFSPFASPGSALDPECVKGRCGEKPSPIPGSCVYDLTGKPGHCAAPIEGVNDKQACKGWNIPLEVTGTEGENPLIGPSGQPTPPPTNTVWIGRCSRDATSCENTADCKQPEPRPGRWLGVCPSVKIPGVAVADCTKTSTELCSPPEIEKPPTDTCEKSGGACRRPCSSNSQCPQAVDISCAAEVIAKCSAKSGLAKNACYRKGIRACQRPGRCLSSAEPIPAGVAASGWCEEVIPAQSEQKCAGQGGATPSSLAGPSAGASTYSTPIWLGACKQSGKQCREDSDCPPLPTLAPSDSIPSGKTFDQ